jgi:predicted nucleic acid-binding protein
MADGLHSKRLALDTNVLLDLAAGHEFALRFKREFQAREIALYCPPGVAAELDHLSVHGTAAQRERSGIALDRLIEWGITPIVLTDVQKRSRKNFMSFVEDRKILPEGEVNDARILADTAIAEIPMLVTSDAGILEADQVALSLAFEDASLRVVHPVHPAKLTRALR